MAEESGQDRSEQPTAHRLRKARQDGQVARSTELPGAAVVIGSFALLISAGGWMLEKLATIFAQGFVFDRKALDAPALLVSLFAGQLSSAFLVVLPLILLTLVLAIFASGLTGGYLFALKAVAPKSSKLDPLNGLKRMFGPVAAIELGKAVLKFLLVSAVLWWSVATHLEALLNLGRMALEPALASAGRMIAQSALWVALSLAVISAIDVPYQKYQFLKRMRMTKQEVRDEFKEMEGRPEIKAQIRRRQREMANSRMMQRVKDADVVIVNPEHFAVALEYDPGSDGAPVLVAKGADFMARQIREQAELHGIHQFSAPPLARALYFTTEAEQQIPEELYHAVAQVIAYVFSLASGSPARPGLRKPIPVVPESMHFNADGSRGPTAEATP